ncbi:MAG: hypothetical protein WC549_09410 [Actinomycetota bacterium]
MASKAKIKPDCGKCIHKGKCQYDYYSHMFDFNYKFKPCHYERRKARSV